MDFNEITEFVVNLSVYEQQFLTFFVASCIFWLFWLLSNVKFLRDTEHTPLFFILYGIAYCIIILCTLPVAIPCLILGVLIFGPIKELVERNIKESKEYATGKDIVAALQTKVELNKQLEKLLRQIASCEQELSTKVNQANKNFRQTENELNEQIKYIQCQIVGCEQELAAEIDRAKMKYRDAEHELNLKSAKLTISIAQLEAKKSRLEQEVTKLADLSVFRRKLSEQKVKVALADEERRLKLHTQHLVSLMETAQSSLTALPYMAKIIADFDTRNLEILARQLDWGDNQERRKKVRSLRELRKETADMLAQYKEAEYKLAYAIAMFPALADFLDADSRDIPELKLSDLTDDGSHDRVRNYLSDEEYRQLPSAERNQLALDRYRASRRKTNWQIGRDYEMYVGYKYEQKGYRVDYYGARKGLEDLGRDLIAVGKGQTLIIQCKYWSSSKVIHEKHITQLYGTMVCYCYENNLPRDQVLGVLVTNIKISDTARKFAEYLGIGIAEEFPFGEYPCIKCNINRSAEGGTTRIYHLPFDQQYDSCVINTPGEFMAMTTAEAEAAGFRRAYRWHSQ